MTKISAATIALLIIFAGVALSQEVIIANFPLGVAGSVDPAIFKPYYSKLQTIADTLGKYPSMHAVITGGADGELYRSDTDAKNPSLALGRAHALRRLLISEFKIDPRQLIVQSEENGLKGPGQRYTSIRIDRELQDLETRVDSLEKRPPLEKHFTEVKQVASPVAVPVVPAGIREDFGVQLAAGISSSPFKLIPVVTAAITWKRIFFLEGIAGHTFWDNSYPYKGSYLETKRRLIGGNIIVFPFSHIPVGVVGGWIRIEEISQEYYEYVRLSEGPVVGIRVTPLEFLSITGLYNPSKQRLAGIDLSNAKNGQFLLAATFHITFGGDK